MYRAYGNPLGMPRAVYLQFCNSVLCKAVDVVCALTYSDMFRSTEDIHAVIPFFIANFAISLSWPFS